MCYEPTFDNKLSSRAPHGARGLKSTIDVALVTIEKKGRAPHGARGLKFLRRYEIAKLFDVAPHTGRVD